MTILSTIKADITVLKVDAIVNAANESLLGGGGVDGAIHHAAGPELLRSCKLLGGCKTGEAKITKGFNLPAKFIIHTVGPVWHGGGYLEAENLRSCYQKSLEIAEANEIRSIAFPSISTGAFGYPFREAAKIAVTTTKEYISKGTSIDEIIFCCFSDNDHRYYSILLKTI